MSSYAPPTENVAIFDTINFTSGDQPLTQNQADKRYLRFPNAQGTENLQAIVVNGTASFNKPITMTGATYGDRLITSSQLNITDSNTNTLGLNISQIGQITDYSSYVNGGSHAFFCEDTLGATQQPLTINADYVTIEPQASFVNSADFLTTSSFPLIIRDKAASGNTTSIYQSSIQTIIRNDETLGNITFRVKTSGNALTDVLSLDAEDANLIIPSSQANISIIAQTNQRLDLSAPNQTAQLQSGTTNYLNLNDATDTVILQAGDANRITLSDATDTITCAATSVGFNATDVSFNTVNPPTCTAVQPASSDSSTKIPTTAWVQSAISSISSNFAPKFINYTDVQTTSGSGYTAGPTINFGGTWAINDIVYFRITTQISYGDSGGAYTNTGNSMGILYFRPYYFPVAWAPISTSGGGVLVQYCSNTPSSVCAADRHPCFYLPCFNIGNTSYFYLNGGTPTNVRIGTRSPEVTGGWEFFVGVEYLGARTASGTISFSNGTDANGINNTLP